MGGGSRTDQREKLNRDVVTIEAISDASGSSKSGWPFNDGQRGPSS